MYKIIPATADAYITNKILNKTTRATDANTGLSSTLDIFKLYSENSFDGEANPIELSRALIKFDLDDVMALTPTTLTDFSCELHMFDTFGGQTTPSNFTLQLFPLAKEFTEGMGRDVESFDDLDVCNYTISSYNSSGPGNILWDTEGADADVDDVLKTGYPGMTQDFAQGTEDLVIDVTDVISDMIDETISNYGFRLSFIAAEETDSKTRFVKRFVSRHSTDKNKTPRLIIKYKDAIESSTDDVNYTNYQATILNLQKEYNHSDIVRLHVFIEDRNYNLVESSKVPLKNKGLLIGSSDVDVGVSSSTLCFSIVDKSSNDIIIPFDKTGTIVSFDADEMFFSLDTNNLTKNNSYEIKFRIYDNTSGLQYTVGEDFIFRVV